MKKHFLIAVGCITSSLAYGQQIDNADATPHYFLGIDGFIGPVSLKNNNPTFTVDNHSSTVTGMRFFQGIAFNQQIALEVGLAYRTRYHQSAYNNTVPTIRYQAELNTTQIDAILSYQLPIDFLNKFSVLGGVVWTKSRYKIHAQYQQQTYLFQGRETEYDSVVGVQYQQPLNKNTFFRINFMKYGKDKLYHIGVAKYFF